MKKIISFIGHSDRFSEAILDFSPLSIPNAALNLSKKAIPKVSKFFAYALQASILLNTFGCLLSMVEPWLFHREATLEFFFVSIVYILANLYTNKLLMDISLGSLAPKTISIETNWYENKSPLLVLIPSYREPIHIIAKSILTSLLQFHPNHKVVLLIDDPIEFSLTSVETVKKINALVDNARSHLRLETEIFEKFDILLEFISVLDSWVKGIDENLDHHGFYDCMEDLKVYFRVLKNNRQTLGNSPIEPLILSKIDNQLTMLFDQFLGAELRYFRRKLYPTILTQEKSKAANLNCFSSCLKEKKLWETTGLELQLSGNRHWDPEIEYLGTLDADTVVSPDWAHHLTLKLKANSDIDLAQSLYAYGGNPRTFVERYAKLDNAFGNLLFYGLSIRDAAQWIGTNGIFSYPKLSRHEKFVDDITVNEDMATTFRLWENGGKIYTIPQILAFSMGPPDLASMITQRERWAIGPIWHGLRVYNGHTQHKINRSLLYFGAPLFVMFEGALLTLFWRPVSLPYSLSLGTSINLFLLSTIYLRESRNPLHLVPLLGGFQIQVPVQMVGIGKTIIQGITGQKMDFVRTARYGGEAYIRAHYAGLIGLLFLSELLSCFFGDTEDSVKRGFTGTTAFLLLLFISENFSKRLLVRTSNAVRNWGNTQTTPQTQENTQDVLTEISIV